MLEAESQGKKLVVNGHEEAAVPVILTAQETQADANVGTGNATVARNQRPTEKQDPLSQWMDSVRKAETWKTGKGSEPVNQGHFGPYPDELEVW